MDTLLVRIFDREGHYPAYPFETGRHLFRPSQELIYGCVIERDNARIREHPELIWYYPEEIRLYAALTLSVPDPEHDGLITFGPWSLVHTSDIASPQSWQSLGGQIEAAIQELQASAIRLESPFLQSETRYNLNERADPFAARPLIELIDAQDSLMLRGLNKLLVAHALGRYHMFMEEAALAAYISLEAALTILRRKLGGGNPDIVSFDEAYGHLEADDRVGSPFVEFLKDLHDLRTILVHPANRFGDFWTPPMMAEDYYEAVMGLVSLWRHLIMDDVVPAA